MSGVRTGAVTLIAHGGIDRDSIYGAIVAARLSHVGCQFRVSATSNSDAEDDGALLTLHEWQLPMPMRRLQPVVQ